MRGHRWDGCMCERCGLVRDIQHCFEPMSAAKQYDEHGNETDHGVKPWDDLHGASVSFRHFNTVACIKCGKVREIIE